MASPAEQEHKLKQFEGLTEEYMEKIIELGYIMMFAAASPVRYVFPLLIWPFHRAPTLPLSVLHTHARARAHTHTRKKDRERARTPTFLPEGEEGGGGGVRADLEESNGATVERLFVRV